MADIIINKHPSEVGTGGIPYSSYSGADIRALIVVPAFRYEQEQKPVLKVLAELQTISISTFREKNAVRALGHVNPKGYCRGTRSQGGSMVFTVFNRNVLEEVMRAKAGDGPGFDPSVQYNGDSLRFVLADQIPPFTICIDFANEYGYGSRMVIYDVEIITEGQTMSVEDMITENVVQFVASGIEPMHRVNDTSALLDPAIIEPFAYGVRGTTFTDLLNNSSASNARAREILSKSRNAFI